jgi:hypothetical protein
VRIYCSFTRVVYQVMLFDQLTYASNSPIPLLLTLRGTDVQALDLLVSAPRLHLLRTVSIGSEAAEEAGLRRSNNTFVSNVAKGVFWPHEARAEEEANVGAGDPGVRMLRGEVFIPKAAKQSFAFPRFACRVRPLCLIWRSRPRIKQGCSLSSGTHNIVHRRSSAAAGVWLYVYDRARGAAARGAHYGHNGQCTWYHPNFTDPTWL